MSRSPSQATPIVAKKDINTWEVNKLEQDGGKNSVTSVTSPHAKRKQMRTLDAQWANKILIHSSKECPKKTINEKNRTVRTFRPLSIWFSGKLSTYLKSVLPNVGGWNTCTSRVVVFSCGKKRAKKRETLKVMRMLTASCHLNFRQKLHLMKRNNLPATRRWIDAQSCRCPLEWSYSPAVWWKIMRRVKKNVKNVTIVKTW